jgi:hypothetical protein
MPYSSCNLAARVITHASMTTKTLSRFVMILVVPLIGVICTGPPPDRRIAFQILAARIPESMSARKRLEYLIPAIKTGWADLLDVKSSRPFRTLVSFRGLFTDDTLRPGGTHGPGPEQQQRRNEGNGAGRFLSGLHFRKKILCKIHKRKNPWMGVC